MANSAVTGRTDIPVLRLKPGRDKPLRAGHPWVFSGAIASPGNVGDGELAAVAAADGERLAYGHYSPGSIAVRVLSRAPIADERLFLAEALRQAAGLRNALALAERPAPTNAYRLVNAEGDGLPGLTIDRYDDCAVIQCHSEGMTRLKPQIVELLANDHRFAHIIDRSPETESASPESRLLHGSRRTTAIVENGILFAVDCAGGQKTGFFLDQRDNRELVERYAAGRQVLNAFCYSGGFSLYALRGGAASVASIDSSAAALEYLRQNLDRNAFSRGLESDKCRVVKADCLQYLTEMNDSYDLIILDPPAFVKHKGAHRGGLKGYESINFHAVKGILPGGILFTFSCSAFVTAEELHGTAARAALRAGRRLRLLHSLGAAACHPLNPAHPEGRYLKGFVFYVD